MFSVGITTTIADFKECLKRPGAIVPWCFCGVGREVETVGIQKIHQYPRMGSVLPVPLSRCPVVAFPLSRCPGPVVPLAVPVGSQRAAAWRTFAFRRHFGKNEVRSPKTVVKLRFARVRRNPFARNEVRSLSPETEVKLRF